MINSKYRHAQEIFRFYKNELNESCYGTVFKRGIFLKLPLFCNFFKFGYFSWRFFCMSFHEMKLPWPCPALRVPTHSVLPSPGSSVPHPPFRRFHASRLAGRTAGMQQMRALPHASLTRCALRRLFAFRQLSLSLTRTHQPLHLSSAACASPGNIKSL